MHVHVMVDRSERTNEPTLLQQNHSPKKISENNKVDDENEEQTKCVLENVI